MIPCKLHLLPPVGEHIALQDGTVLAVTDALLQSLVDSYKPDTSHEAPIVLGHMSDDGLPKHDGAPAHGWIKQLYTEQGGLYADAEITEQAYDWVQSGLYKKLSIMFYTPKSHMNPATGEMPYLRHVALLGAQPPVIKGLEPYSFSECDCKNKPVIVTMDKATAISKLGEYMPKWLVSILEYGESGFKDGIDHLEPEPSEANDYLLGKDGTISGVFVDTQGTKYKFSIVPSPDGNYERAYSPIDKINEDEIPMRTKSKDEKGMSENEAMPMTEAKDKDMPMGEDYEQDMPIAEDEDMPTVEDVSKAQQDLVDTTDEKVAKSDYDALMKELRALREENRMLREEQEALEFSELSAQVTSLYKSGKLHEGIIKQDELTKALFGIKGVAAIKLSETDKPKQPKDILLDLLNKLPEVVPFGEMAKATADSNIAPDLSTPRGTTIDQSQAELHQRALALCEKQGHTKPTTKQYLDAIRSIKRNLAN